jgi:hypothetical protein
MTDKTRDKLLISMAILVHDLADKSPSALCSLQEDKDALWMAITKATAKHHKDERKTKEQSEKSSEVPLAKRFCGNCGHQAESKYPDDIDYIFCSHIKEHRHKGAPCCACWAPDQESYE